MKKIVLATILTGLTLSTASVFAEISNDVVVPSVPEVTSVAPVTENTEIIKEKSLASLKAKGARLIKERVASLQANATSVASSKGLTTEQKAAFATFFSGKTAELTTLGSTIASSTDASSTKVLVNSIFTNFRIYAIVIPQIRLEKRIYELQNHITKLGDTFAKVQTAIDAQKAKGKDVAVWQKGLDDAKVSVASSSQKLSGLLTQISALKPSDYGTTSKTVIQSVNTDVKNVAKDLQKINGKIHRPYFLKNVASTTIQRGENH